MQPPAPQLWPTLPVAGSDAVVGVRRIVCIGKNYADHVAEMGGDARRDPPVHFTKSPDALLVAHPHATLAYPPRTANLHHEVELVLVLGAGGRDVPTDRALDLVYGYAIGLDMTRRDLQHAAKAQGGPWDAAKDFDHGAVVGPVSPVSQVGHPAAGFIRIDVNGVRRQDGDLAQMIWSVPEILAELSAQGELRAGDLIFTGTPAGVGPVVRGDQMVASIEGLGAITVDVA